MTYKVTFRKRFNAEGEAADRPESFVHVVEGVVLNAARSEIIEPPAKHNQEVLDEDDNFESLGTETWEYQIAEGRDREFVEALQNSRMVIQYEEIEELV